MRGVNDEEVVDFVALTKDKEIDVRFIEYMPFGGNKWNTDKLVPYKEMMHAIKNRYPNIQRLDSSNFITAKVIFIILSIDIINGLMYIYIYIKFTAY